MMTMASNAMDQYHWSDCTAPFHALRNVMDCEYSYDPMGHQHNSLSHLHTGNIAGNDYSRPLMTGNYLQDTFESDLGFDHKDVQDWTDSDILQWINKQAEESGKCCTEFSGEKFIKFTGKELLQLSVDQFQELDPQYGKFLFDRLHQRTDKQHLNMSYSTQYLDTSCNRQYTYSHLEPAPPQPKFDSSKYLGYTPNCPPPPCEGKEESHSPTITNLDQQNFDINKKQEAPKKGKGRPGRPPGAKRKNKPEKVGRLWEFIRDLFKNQDPSLIAWENYDEGVFRFGNSAKVAELWGNKKGNKDMNYEKLSRAMRYYYKSGIFQPVLGRRLVYKFGPKATGWKNQTP